MPSEIIIVPCTREKIWSIEPQRGEVPARGAYIKRAFARWRDHAENSGLPWVILSTKYGFLDPDQQITNYEARVSSAKSDPGYMTSLQEQARSRRLSEYDRITVLDWEAFEDLVKMALGGIASKVHLKKIMY
ncbi:MAG: hypothetical protein GY906_05250 [bacterium]|nr:hypothetical protein [bacterium]